MQTLNAIRSYHAHVYFDGDEQRRVASALRDQIARRFPVWVGELWSRPIGPHPLPMFEVAFETGEFSEIVPYLMLNRNGLPVLVHPNTGHPRRDHLENSLWLGRQLEHRRTVSHQARLMPRPYRYVPLGAPI